jgi:hypothetical protein
VTRPNKPPGCYHVHARNEMLMHHPLSSHFHPTFITAAACHPNPCRSPAPATNNNGEIMGNFVRSLGFFLTLTSLTATTASAAGYVGERCWDLNLTLLGGLQGEVRFAVTRVADGYFNLTGVGTIVNDVLANAGPIKGVIVSRDGVREMLVDWVITLPGETPYVSHNSVLAPLDENDNAFLTGISIGNASLFGGTDIEAFTGTISAKACD